MPIARSSSSALGLGLILSAILTGNPRVRADDVKPGPTPTSSERSPSEGSTPPEQRNKRGANATPAPTESNKGTNGQTEKPAETDVAKKDSATQTKKSGRATRESNLGDAEIAARRPPPPSNSLDPQGTKLTRVKTEGTGAGQTSDESDKLATPPSLTSRPAVVPATPPKNESDEKLRERVQATLLSDRKLPYTARMVRVEVKDGKITLAGEVNTDHERMLVSQVVDRIRAGHDMINHISVRNRSRESLQATSR